MNAVLSDLRTTSFSHIPTINAGSSLTIPVQPSQFIYSQFNYVRGVSSADAPSVSVTKIKILDTLIGQLVKMQQKPDPAPTAESRQDARQTDALIAQYKKQIDTVSAATADIPYISQQIESAAPKPGALFSFTL